MGVYEGRGLLGKQIKQLQTVWSRTHVDWDDANAREFEERFLQPLERDVRFAVSAMDHMTSMMAQAKRDCEAT